MSHVRKFLEEWATSPVRGADDAALWRRLRDAIDADEAATPPDHDAEIRRRLEPLTARWNEMFQILPLLGAEKTAEALRVLHAQVREALLPAAKGGAA